MGKLIVILSILLAVLQFRLWVGEGSVPNVYRLRAQVTEQTRENQRLAERNRSLEAEVVSLKQGDAAIEGRARTDLGMVRGDETFFLIVNH